MYVNLVALMKERGWTYETLADLLGVHINTIGRRMRRESEWNLREMLTIRAHLNTEMCLMDIFKWEGGQHEIE